MKIDRVINLATLAVLAGIVIVQVANFRRSEPVAKSAVAAGTALQAPDIDWSGHDSTLIIALSTQCRFCDQSIPFHQALATHASGHLAVVSSFVQGSEEGRKYLSAHGISVGAVVKESPASLGVHSTPTLLLADKKGRVIQSWVGRLSDSEQKAVLEKIDNSTQRARLSWFDLPSFPGLKAKTAEASR
jgi:hypothetical protein